MPKDEVVSPADEQPGQPAGPCAMVIFGAAGDLTKRKLIPALCNLARGHLLPEEFAVVGVSRAPLSTEEFLLGKRRERQDPYLQRGRG